MNSYQNLSVLQNLYKLKALGFDYIDHFQLNEERGFESEVTNFEQLISSIRSCHLCDLSKSRTQSMSGFGSVNADLFIVDNRVSQMQDEKNEYFVGRSAAVLKNMLEKVIGVAYTQVYYTHAIKCKTLHTHQPSPSEWNSCKNHLFLQLEFVKPKVIMVLGEEAYGHLSGDTENFENVRGHIINFKNYKLVPVYHPQYLLRNPELKKITMNDLKTIKSCLV